MAKFVVGDGLDNYVRQLEKLSSEQAVKAIKYAVYPGARIVTDAVDAAIDALPEVEEAPKSFAPEGYKLQGITPLQKKGLKDGLGLSVMRSEDGVIYTKLGFDGYNEVKTKKYPSGQPNALIARALESGTSFRVKIKFIDKAVKGVKAEAEKAMSDAFDDWVRTNTTLL